MAETTPITPVDLLDAQQPFGDASLSRIDPPTRARATLLDRFLRSPLLFWSAQTLLCSPLVLFLLQGLMEEMGQPGVARDINLLLFGQGRHTIVGDILPVLVLPAVAIVIALARIRDAKPGIDRKATIWAAFVGLCGMGIVLGYAFLENFGRLLR